MKTKKVGFVRYKIGYKYYGTTKNYAREAIRATYTLDIDADYAPKDKIDAQLMVEKRLNELHGGQGEVQITYVSRTDFTFDMRVTSC